MHLPLPRKPGRWAIPASRAACALALALSWSPRTACPADAPGRAPHPNFLVVLGEGHGWSSTSVSMDDAQPPAKSARVRTPNLEALAKAGMRFAEFYAPSPRCTPSRATFLTGISPAQLHMTFVGEGKADAQGASGRRLIPPACLLELPESTTTVAEVLRRAGYATAHFGKWHLGRLSPSKHGFDESDGPTGNGGPDNVDNPHPQQLFGMTHRGNEFMARQVKAGKPFYLQLSHYASRHGGDARPESVATVKSWGGNLDERELAEAAATYDLDVALGLTLARLDELGVAGTTFVVFTTDHGSPGRNPPFRGGKGTVSQGGLRVPFIIRGPGIKAGSCSPVRAIGADLAPTIVELARVKETLPAGVEGGSLAAVLAAGGAGAAQRPFSEFVVHFPHYDKDPLGPASAIILDEYKLIHAYQTGTLQLFHIARDPGESRDLARELPQKARELDDRLMGYLAAVKAQMPTVNSDDNPRQPPPALRGGPRGQGREQAGADKPKRDRKGKDKKKAA